MAVTQPPPRVRPDPATLALQEKENKAKLEKIAQKKEEMEYYNRMIPRTGIDQPFLIDPPKHIRSTNDLERINDISSMLKMAIIEDYKMRENDRIMYMAKLVYDVEKDSPNYKNSNEYI